VENSQKTSANLFSVPRGTFEERIVVSKGETSFFDFLEKRVFGM